MSGCAGCNGRNSRNDCYGSYLVEHLDAFDDIDEGEALRRGHEDGSGDREVLRQSQLHVAGPGRPVQRGVRTHDRRITREPRALRRLQVDDEKVDVSAVTVVTVVTVVTAVTAVAGFESPATVTGR